MKVVSIALDVEIQGEYPGETIEYIYSRKGANIRMATRRQKLIINVAFYKDGESGRWPFDVSIQFRNPGMEIRFTG